MTPNVGGCSIAEGLLIREEVCWMNDGVEGPRLPEPDAMTMKVAKTRLEHGEGCVDEVVPRGVGRAPA